MDYKKIIERIIHFGLIFLIVFTPLAFGSVHIWAYTIMELIVFSLLILWAIKQLIYLDFKIEKSLFVIYIVFALFLLIIILQTIPLPPNIIKVLSPKTYELYSMVIPGYKNTTTYDFLRSISIYPYATKVYIVKIISYIGIFLLVTHEIKGKKKIEMLLITLILAGFFEALYGLYGYFSMDKYILGFKKLYGVDSASGTYVNRNHFAGYMGMVIPLTAGYLSSMLPGKIREGYGLKHRIIDFLHSPKATIGGLFLIIIITMILGIVFSLSRMGVISLIVSLLSMILISLIKQQKKLRNILIVIIFFGIIISLWYGIEPLIDRYLYTADSLIKDRFIVWSATYKLIKDFPLIGTGFGTYRTVYQRYKPSDFRGRLAIYDHAHNDYLELISEVGIIGAIPVFIGLVYFLILIIRKWSKRRHPFARGIGLGGIGAIIYMLLHSIMDFNMHIPANALTFFIIMALTYRTVEINRRS